MSFSLNGGLLAMEEIDNGGENMGDVEAAEVAATVADESAEIQESNTDVGIEVAKVEDAVQAGEELEALGDLAADSLENGEGLSEESAEAVSIAVESILNRLGATRETRTVPVAESFGNASSRRVSTKLVVEGIGDWLKKIWASIKAAAARLWDKIRSFLAGLFNSAKSLSKMLVGLKERARKVPSDYAPKEKKIKAAGVAKSINWKGKAGLGTFELTIKAASSLAKAAGAVTAEIKKINDAASSLASSEINEANVKTFVDKKSAASAAIVAAFDSGMTAGLDKIDQETALVKKEKAKVNNKKTGDTTVKGSFGPFPGNTVLTCVVSSNTVLGVKEENVSLAFEAAPGKVAEEVDALSISEIQGVIETSLKLSNAIADFQATQKNAEAITKAQQGVADTILKQAEKILAKTGSSSETRQGLSELKSSVADSMAMLNTFGNNAPTMTFRAARAGADYASVCLRNLGPKSK